MADNDALKAAQEAHKREQLAAIQAATIAVGELSRHIDARFDGVNDPLYLLHPSSIDLINSLKK